MSLAAIAFYACAAAAVVAAGLLVTVVRHPVTAACCLLGVSLSVAGVLALLGAHALAVLSLLTHVSIAIGLFAFAVALEAREGDEARGPVRPLGSVLKLFGVGALAGVLALVGVSARLRVDGAGPVPEGFGSLPTLGAQLFDAHWVPLELLGLVLGASLVSALFLAARPAGPSRPAVDASSGTTNGGGA